MITQLTDLDPATVAEVTALLDAATAEDGTPPVGEHVLLGLTRPGTHLVARDEGELVGYAQLDRNDADGTAELAVLPKARRHGVGTELVRTLVADVPDVRIWAHGEHPGALALAAKLRFRLVRALWQMRRSLLDPSLPDDAGMPAGVRLRPFVVGRDEPEFLRVNNAAFDWHPEQGGWDDTQIAEREAQPWFDPAGFLLAEDNRTGALLGYHWTKVHTSPEPIGEVYVLGVDPAAQGRRLGAALTLAGLRYLRDSGLHDVMLYVESDNHAAVRVYQKLGFVRWHTDAAFMIAES